MSINISKSIKMSLADKLENFEGHMFHKPSLFTAWNRDYQANEISNCEETYG